jgi:hypothetical protein
MINKKNYDNTYIIFEDPKNKINKPLDKLRKNLNKLGLNEETMEECKNSKSNYAFIWFRYINNTFDKKIIDKFFSNPSAYVINNICKITCVTDKFKLYENMKNNFPDNYLEMIPYSFQLTKHTKYEKDTIYITRPVNIKKINYPANSGYGINVYDSEETLEIAKKNMDEFDVVVSSKYINNPLLFKGIKFHLRCHIFITIINNKLSGHLSNNFLLFLAKEKYKKEDYQNKDIHDTHYNNYSDKSFFFPKDFTNENISNFNESATQIIFNQIKEIAKKITIITSKNVKIPKNAKNSFHLIGMDVLIDENLRVFLLECNRNIDPTKGNTKLYFDYYLNSFWDWVDEIILKPAFLNDNSCDKDAVYSIKGDYR